MAKNVILNGKKRNFNALWKKHLPEAEKNCTNKTTPNLSLINSPHSKAQFKSFKEKQGEIGNFQALMWYPGTHQENSDCQTESGTEWKVPSKKGDAEDMNSQNSQKYKVQLLHTADPQLLHSPAQIARCGNRNTKKEEQKLYFISDFTSAFYDFNSLVRCVQKLPRNRSLLLLLKILFNFIIIKFHFSLTLT